MGDVSSDHSQTSGDAVVDEAVAPSREPISAKGEQDPLSCSFCAMLVPRYFMVY